MKTRCVVGVAVLVVGCHQDKLVTSPGGGNRAPPGRVHTLVFASGPAPERQRRATPPRTSRRAGRLRRPHRLDR